MEVVLIFPSALASVQALTRIINKFGGKASLEDGCIICKAHVPANLVSFLANLPGVGSITIAKKVTCRFSDIVSGIVQTGSEAILPNEKFYVKVVQTAKANY